MLEVQKLSKSYGKSLAVDEVSFFVPDGTVGILLGPNGAGKSTIIKSIAGLLRYQGRIGIQGLPARSVEAKRQFAYVPEMPAMFDALSVREHIEYMRKAYNSGITDEEVEALPGRRLPPGLLYEAFYQRYETGADRIQYKRSGSQCLKSGAGRV